MYGFAHGMIEKKMDLTIQAIYRCEEKEQKIKPEETLACLPLGTIGSLAQHSYCGTNKDLNYYYYY